LVKYRFRVVRLFKGVEKELAGNQVWTSKERREKNE
jgi:hypothetical protein